MGSTLYVSLNVWKRYLCRIQKQEVEADFQREKRKVEEAHEDARKQPDLETQMKEFLEVRCSFFVWISPGAV